MTEFKILRDNILAGFEMHDKDGISHRYSSGVVLRGPFIGAFPIQPGDVKVLITRKREEKQSLKNDVITEK